MAGVFETSSDAAGAEASPITVKAGVAPAPDTHGQLLRGLAVEAGMEGIAQHALGVQQEALGDIQERRNEELGEMRLKALSDKFDTLATGMQQGLPTSQANARARAALAEAKSSVPWIGTRADDAFKSFFGGSAGGFEESPLEVAAQEHQLAVANTAAALGSNLRDAEMVVKTAAQNEVAEQMLTQQKLSQEGNEGAFRSYTNTKLQGATVNTQAIIRAHLPPGEFVLKAEGLASVKASVSTLANQMRSDLRAQLFKPDGTPYLLEASSDARFMEIDKWEERQKKLLEDRSYITVMQSVRDQGNVELEVAANDLFQVYRIADIAGGQVIVDAVNKGIIDTRYVATLTARDPQLAKFFQDDGEVRQMTAAGLAKAFGRGEITDPDSNIAWARGAMQRGGAQTTQAFLAEPSNAPVTETAYNQVSSEKPEEAKGAMGYHREAGAITPNETAHTLNSKVFTNYLRKKPDEGFKILSSSLEGMSQSFKSAFFLEASGVPTYVSVSPLAPINGKARTSFNISTEGGGAVPETAKATIAHQYSVLVNNPAYVQRFEELMGIPLTPAEVVEIMVNDTIHPKFAERAAEQKEAGTFKGFPKREEERIFENLSLGGKMLKFWNAPRIPAKEIGKRAKEAIVDPAKSQMEDIFGKPEAPAMPELTPEQVQEIKNLPTLEEKKAKALEFGIPQELIDDATRGQ